MKNLVQFLQLFADEGAAAAPAGGTETAPAAEIETAEVPVKVGDTMADGTTVENAKVAAALNRQLNRHPELRKVYGQTGAQPAQIQQAQPAQIRPEQTDSQESVPAEQTAEEKWEALKKGEYKEMYGRDVQNAIRDRFKNQSDAQQKLDGMQPMLQALMKKAGAESVEELQELILNDDSLYEDEAEARGMTVEQYKHMKELEDEHARNEAEKQQREQHQMLQNHVATVRQQAEELKQMFPGFDLDKEMTNPDFVRMTMPGQLSVKQAYMALHGDELIPQLMTYGMDRAKEQIGQTIQAQRQRPAEGAMSGKSQQAAEPKIDPAKLTRKEREMYKKLARQGYYVSFD